MAPIMEGLDPHSAFSRSINTGKSNGRYTFYTLSVWHITAYLWPDLLFPHKVMASSCNNAYYSTGNMDIFFD
jgi:hypothetical protein